METVAFKKDKVYQELRQDILSGKYQSGYRLPRELDFCRQLGVAKITLRSALEKLEEEGLVLRVPGKGTFIDKTVTSDTILLVYLREYDSALPQNYIIPGIEAAAVTHGFKTEVCFIEYLRQLGVESAVELLNGKNLRGVVMISSNCQLDDPEIQIFHRVKVPVVIAHGGYQDRITGFSVLYTKHRQGIRCALEYLAGSGHRLVKVLSMHPERMRDWKKEELPELFKELGLESEGQLLYHTNSSFKRGAVRQAVDEIVGTGDMPTAILCYSDFMAMEVMQYLQELGIRIPEDIAVMGYCGYPGGTYLKPSLSTVDFEYAAIGRSAVELLAQSDSWFQVPKVVPPVIATPFKLVERDSTRIIRKEASFWPMTRAD